MAETATKKDDETREAEEIARGIGGLPINHPQAGYVSPDLSFKEGVGELPDREKEWHEERDDAREEDVKAIAKSEKEIVELRQEAQDEASEKAKEARDKQVDTQVKAGLVAAPTPTTDEILADKIGGKSKSKAS